MAEKLTQYVATNPDLLLQGVVEIFVDNSKIASRLHFIDLKNAFGLDWNQETSLGGVGERSLNADFAAGAKGNGASAPLHEGTAIIGGEVCTDTLMLSARQNRIAQKVKAAALRFNKLFIEGNRTADGTQFNGCYVRTVSRKAGQNGGVLNLDVLSNMLARIPGDNAAKVLLMGWEMRLLLGALIRSQGSTQIARTEWEGQLTPASYDGATILDPGEDELGKDIMGFDETCGQSQVTSSIVAARLGSNIDGEFLQGTARLNGGALFNVDMQGARGTQDITVVQGVVGLASFHPRCVQRYAGIVNSLAAPSAPPAQ